MRTPGRLLTDALFAALDEVAVDDGDGQVKLEVVGIVRSEEHVWVQIGPAGRPAETLVVRLPSDATAVQAVAEVREAWQACRASATRASDLTRWTGRRQRA